MRRADRLFQIVQHLRARRLTTAAQLSRLAQVSERTIYRDIRDLTLSGIPILGEAGVGYRIDSSFDLTPLMFTREEVEAIVVGLRMIESFGDLALQRAASPALNKITLALPRMRQSEVEQPRIFVPNFRDASALKNQLGELRAAINDHATIRIQYTKADESSSRRTLRPLALHFWGQVWTLATWCELRQEFRTFRVDRIQEFKRTGKNYKDEAGKTLTDYLYTVGAKVTENKG